MFPGTFSRRLSIAVLLAVVVSAPVRSYATNPDSVRAEIARLIAAGRQQMSEMSATSLDSSIRLYETARSLAATYFGDRDTAVASAMNQLSLSYYWKSDYPRAWELISDALDILEETLGPNHPTLARTLRIKGDILAWQGRIAEAEPTYLRALKLLEIADISENSYKNREALIRNNLGLLYITQRRLERADSAFHQAGRIWTGLYGDESRWIASVHQNLGTVRSLQGRSEESLEHFRRALSLLRRIVGPDHLWVAHAASSLADVLMAQGKLDEAAELFTDAIRIQTLAFSEDDPLQSTALYKMATLEGRRGNWDRAVMLAERVERLAPATEGFYSPRQFVRQSHLASVYAGAGLDSMCLATFQHMISTRRTFLNGAFAYASAAQKMRYLRQDPLVDDRFLSWAVEQDSEAAASAALEMVLSGKGFVIDALAAEREAAYCSENADLAAKLERHADISGAIAALVLNTVPADGMGHTLSDLYRAQDSLEVSISRDCAEYRAELASRRFSVEDIAEALPKGSILWEFIRYRPFNFESYGSRDARYLSFLLAPNGTITTTDHGDAQRIDSLVAELRSGFQGAPELIYSDGEKAAEVSIRKIARALYEVLFEPVASTIGEAHQIIVDPDADLNLIPFATLCNTAGQYLIEHYEISYVSSGRDLLKAHSSRDNVTGSVIVISDPDFELASEVRQETLVNLRGPFASGGDPTVRLDLHDCLSSPYDPLPATQAEGAMVAQVSADAGLATTDIWSGGQASEERLKSMNGAPRVLHLATHGYYCEAATSGDSSLNPLLYSGLALAGANRMLRGNPRETPAGDDGILTALEASGLNLIGTELVVLSACQTGLGGVVSGEGVFGLRRAFQHAGVNSVIMSMFSVPDDATVTLMKRFYKNWLAGASKSRALREAALSVLRDRREQQGAAHPLFWGGFILAGDPR